MTSYNAGNPAFRNREPWTIFNKQLNRPENKMYTFLNEVESVVQHRGDMQSDFFSSYKHRFKDPRTKKLVNEIYCEHTKDLQMEIIFQCRSSILHRDQQNACLRVLTAKQQGEPIKKEDLLIWKATTKKRLKENDIVQKLIHDFTSKNFGRLFDSMKPLVFQYRRYYEHEKNRLLKTLANGSYVTCTGLPHLQFCQTPNKNTASITDVKLVNAVGTVRLWPGKSLENLEWKSLYVHLERYILNDLLPTECNDLINFQSGQENFVLPLESLLMLLTTGAYVDLPTEMLLHVKKDASTDYKTIEFERPLPSRQCGCHTNSHLVAKAFRSCISQAAQEQWLQFTDSGKVLPMNDFITHKRVVSNDNHLEYKVHEFDITNRVDKAKSNKAIVEWRLKSSNDDEKNLQIFSTMEIPAMQNVSGSQVVGSHFIKLEHKPSFGCEIMTSYELLSAWIQLQLMQSEIGFCTRISVHDFTPLLEERLTLGDLEEQLMKHYSINVENLLSSLFNFLKLLSNIDTGQYMLRYTSKFKDKLLLCSLTASDTNHNIKLHDLLTSISCDSYIFQDYVYLPISINLCSAQNLQNKVLPCAFPSKKRGEKRKTSKTLNIGKPSDNNIKKL